MVSDWWCRSVISGLRRDDSNAIGMVRFLAYGIVDANSDNDRYYWCDLVAESLIKLSTRSG